MKSKSSRVTEVMSILVGGTTLCWTIYPSAFTDDGFRRAVFFAITLLSYIAYRINKKL